jgi:hypothetical protein
MTMLLEQHSSSSEVGGGGRSPRRSLAWNQTEVSGVRRAVAWLALAITVVILVLLLFSSTQV